jgi:hypothetical protein
MGFGCGTGVRSMRAGSENSFFIKSRRTELSSEPVKRTFQTVVEANHRFLTMPLKTHGSNFLIDSTKVAGSVASQ